MHLRYGSIDLAPETKYVGVLASQFFRHDGVNAVIFDASTGFARLALTADAKIDGIAIVPKGEGAGSDSDYWKSSATSGEDKIGIVVARKDTRFILPASTTVTQAMVGDLVDLIAVNDGTATTVDVGASTTDIFIVDDLGINVKADAKVTDVVVRINKS